VASRGPPTRCASWQIVNSVGSLNLPRAEHTLTLPNNGPVLAAGLRPPRVPGQVREEEWKEGWCQERAKKLHFGLLSTV